MFFHIIDKPYGNSFAGTSRDDRAYLGGLQDFHTDDIRLFSAHELAREAGISYKFGELEKDTPYPAMLWKES